MKKKQLGILCAAVALCGTAMFGTYAWLTSQSQTLTNEFATTTDRSKIDVTLTEDAFTNDVKENAKKYIPGDVFPKNPTITNTSEELSSFVAIKVTYQLNENNKGFVNVGKDTFNTIASLDKINSGWTLIGKTADGSSELYMYDTELAKNVASNPLFNSVIINADLEENLYPFNVVVTGFATQADNASQEQVVDSLLGLAGVPAL